MSVAALPDPTGRGGRAVNGARKKPIASEATIQAAIVDYVRAVVPEGYIYAIPNAARRTQGGRAGNAVAGLTKGVFDLSLLLPNERVAFIEVKRPGEELRPEQQAFRDVLVRFGTPHCVATSIDDVRAALAQWNVPTRESTP